MNKSRALAMAAAAAILLQVVAVVGIMPALATSNSGAPSGAIFTTDENGTRVNQNIYDDKRDVYIDGGPGPNAPQKAAGLDDGNYYFQVTGTDGKTLLSSDPVKCREFRVKDGIIVEYVSANRTFAVTGGYRYCHLDGKQNGRHDTGTDQDHGAVTIQLMPYNNTSNPGGVYKVWITPTSEFQGNASLVDNDCDSGCQHGFKHSASKTDNFKVKVSSSGSGTVLVAPLLTVKKFDDTNGNGKWDSGEPEIGVDAKIDGGGWPVAVVDPAGIASYGYTRYTYSVGFAGYYTTVESTHKEWVQTSLAVDGVAKNVNATAKVKFDYTSGEKHTVTYGNFECFEVSGAKVNDKDGDGKWDSGEPTLSDWTIRLYRGDTLYKETKTGTDGRYAFKVCEGGSYKVKEVNQNGWTQTGHKDFSFSAKSGVDRKGLVFTNHKDSTCLLTCLGLDVPSSTDLDSDLSFDVSAATDVSAFVNDCADLIATVTAEAEAAANAAVDTDNGCGCDSSSGSDNNPCEVSCTTPCNTGCGGPSGGSSTSANTTTEVTTDVVTDVSADTGSCGCDTSTDVSADISVDVTADVGATADFGL